MPHKLNNYLRTYRKKAGLSQDEVAFLLGTRSGTKVSRYERLTRQPGVKTIFALEVIFRAPARNLFAGAYEKVERSAVKRALLLARRLSAGKPDRMLTHKLTALRSIYERAARQATDSA